MAQQHNALSKEQDIRAAQRIYQEWDEALGAKDVEAAISPSTPQTAGLNRRSFATCSSLKQASSSAERSCETS